MSIFDKFRNWLLAPLMGSQERERLDRIERTREYRQGEQRLPLKTKLGQTDHNVVLNLVGTVVDRSIALLFGKGVEFDLPGEAETPQDVYLDEVWRLNKRSILLHKTALIGAEVGTCAIQMIPDGWYSAKLKKNLPRLLSVDTAFLKIETEPDDVDQPVKYTIEYVTKDGDKEVGKKQEISRIVTMDAAGSTTTWMITDSVMGQNGKWEVVNTQEWEYVFPPLIAWQNLPTVGTPYGQPDITPDIIRLQDKVNFIASNINKIIALHAHPRTIGKNLMGNIEVKNDGPDQFWQVSGENADVKNLEMQSDLSSSTRYLEILRQSLFDATHTIDISSMADKVGALTNFGLRVLYQDALQKLGVKRELYGDALREINHALLVLGGFGDDPDPGEVIFPEPLPVNEAENVVAIQADLGMGIVSKQTASEKRGYKWEDQEKLIEGEKASEGNIGELLIRKFNRGQV